MDALMRAVAPRRGAIDRRHLGELDQIDRRAEVLEHAVGAVHKVVRRAHYETMITGLVRREAERISPDNAEVHAMIDAAAAVATVGVIGSMTRRY